MPVRKARIAYWVKKALADLDELDSNLSEATGQIDGTDDFDDAVEQVRLFIDRELKPMIKELLSRLS